MCKISDSYSGNFEEYYMYLVGYNVMQSRECKLMCLRKGQGLFFDPRYKDHMYFGSVYGFRTDYTMLPTRKLVKNKAIPLACPGGL
jgi:hypothetical protein